MSPIRIPICQPDLAGDEKSHVDECIDTAWISARGRLAGRRILEAVDIATSLRR